MPKRIEYVKGQMINECMYLGDAPNKGINRIGLFKCMLCGNEFEAYMRGVVTGKTKSCGCYQKEMVSKLGKSMVKHGMAGNGPERSKEYGIWSAMKSRCENPNIRNYHRYGGRGIEVGIRWRGENGFANFYKDIGPCPPDKDSLDRFPNVNGNYEPTNCRWATQKEQCNNKGNNRLISYNGETLTLQHWAEKAGMIRNTLVRRLGLGWSMEKATGIQEKEGRDYQPEIAHAFGFIG